MSNPVFDMGSGGASLENDFLQDFMSAGVYDFASDIGIIQDGQIPSVKAHEQSLPPTQWNGAQAVARHAMVGHGVPPAYYASSGTHMASAMPPQFAVDGTPVLRSSQQSLSMPLAAATLPSLAMAGSGRRAGSVQDRAMVAGSAHAHLHATSSLGTPSGLGASLSGAGVGGATSLSVGAEDAKGFSLKKKKKGGKGGGSSDKGGKGLRHFSMKVCSKVESKGRTTYNEVADELVAELSSIEHGGSPDIAYDEKNIRRRVYDALNVLMAMDIISKEKKEISWRGLPTTKDNSFDHLREDKKRVKAQIDSKRLYLKELVDQKKALEALIERNKAHADARAAAASASASAGDVGRAAEGEGAGAPSSSDKGAGPDAAGGVGSQYGVQLPFLVVQTRPDAKVDVQLSEDRQLVSFDFTYNPFEIHDENYVLQNMVTNKFLKIKKDPPPA